MRTRLSISAWRNALRTVRMRRSLLPGIALLVASVSVPGCGATDTTTHEPGTRGGACYGNGTCNDGLHCTDGVCVRVGSKDRDSGAEPRVDGGTKPLSDSRTLDGASGLDLVRTQDLGQGQAVDQASPQDSSVVADSTSSADSGPPMNVTWTTKFVAIDTLSDLNHAFAKPTFYCLPIGRPYSLRLNSTNGVDGTELYAATCGNGGFGQGTLPSGLRGTNSIGVYDTSGSPSFVSGFSFKVVTYDITIPKVNTSIPRARMSNTHITWMQANGGPPDLTSYRLSDGKVTNHTQGQRSLCPYRYGLANDWVYFGTGAGCTTFLDYYRLDLLSGQTHKFVDRTTVTFGGNERFKAAGAFAYSGRFTGSGATAYEIHRLTTTSGTNQSTVVDSVPFSTGQYINHFRDTDGVHGVTLAPNQGVDVEVVLSRFSDGQTTNLSNDSLDQKEARISGDYVVWSHDQGAVKHLILYRISTGKSLEITDATHVLGGVLNTFDVEGDYVVFETPSSNREIFAHVYKISTGQWSAIERTVGHSMHWLPERDFISGNKLMFSILRTDSFQTIVTRALQ